MIFSKVVAQIHTSDFYMLLGWGGRDISCQETIITSWRRTSRANVTSLSYNHKYQLIRTAFPPIFFPVQ